MKIRSVPHREQAVSFYKEKPVNYAGGSNGSLFRKSY